jgi:hypothetical protein
MPAAPTGATLGWSGDVPPFSRTAVPSTAIWAEVLVMREPAPSHEDPTVLKERIVRALAALRGRRMACARSETATNIELRERAEVELDALLDFYSLSRRRQRPQSTTAGVALRT